MEPGSVTDVTPRDAAVIVPARNEAERIAATVRAALTLGPVLVVDDGSRDATARIAGEAGAEVLRLPRNRGKGAALDAGLTWVYGGRDGTGVPSPSAAADVIRAAAYAVFLDADLGATAAAAAALVAAVRDGECDMAVALPPPQPGGGHGFVVRAARKGIRRLCGFEAEAPLSGQRCLTRDAALAARPYGSRFGVEVGLTVDLVRAGYRVAEIPADVRHRVTGKDWRAQVHRAGQYRDVLIALAVRRHRKRRTRSA